MRHCIICGAEYPFKCKRIDTWRAICDTEEHYQIYMMLGDYRKNRVSAADMQAFLNRIGISISDVHVFLPSVANRLSEILGGGGNASVVTDVIATNTDTQPQVQHQNDHNYNAFNTAATELVENIGSITDRPTDQADHATMEEPEAPKPKRQRRSKTTPVDEPTDDEGN
jgi:hypothetical protein